MTFISGPWAGAIRAAAKSGAACVLGLAALGAQAYSGPAGLQSKYAELRGQLSDNNFHRPLYIESSEAGDTLKGDIYAVLDYPFASVSSTLKNPADWCDIMLLPFNTKACRAQGGNEQTTLQVRIGRKSGQAAQDAYPLEFRWQPIALKPDYFESRLVAAKGPIGTRDYDISVSVVPLDGGHTFMHLSYSYGYGFAGRMAMQTYLATTGAEKVGFSVSGKDGNGQPVYIGGVRGAIERTAMRYYLAIDAHLASLKVPPDQQLEKRLQTWFNSSERYARQLHEMDRATYVTMKLGEYGRQQAAAR
ncbi:MAG: hypothetical protein JWP43_401 [Ramlibacter sp.]|nr:hypothetical protein [Ramlibacter sp.]